MEKFFDTINDYIGDNYLTFGENPEVDGSGPWMISDIVFGFTYIKLLDCALRHSKRDILKEVESSGTEESIMGVALYPNGETLGFYNSSKYDLEKLCENPSGINGKFDLYIDGFSDNVKAVFDKMNFNDVLAYLDETKCLFRVLNAFNDAQFKENYFSSFDRFMTAFSDFIRIVWKDEFYHIGRDPISTYDALSSYHYIHEALEEYGSFLNTLLLTDMDFENNENVKIYDPDSSGTYILKDAKDSISEIKRNSGHFDADIEIYGKSKKQENEIIYLAKKSVSKKDPYEIDGATILDVSEDIFTVNGIDSYCDFNLIVSNYLYNGLTEYKDILDAFKKDIANDTKLVLALGDFDEIKSHLSDIVSSNNLEAIISFKNHYIIIANLNKAKHKEGHFLLIDESDAELKDELVQRENKEAFSNNEYDIFNSFRWKTLTESDRNKMKAIIDSYAKFEDSINSKLIKNEDYDEEMIKILLN